MITLQQSNQLKALAILMMLCLHLFNRDYHGLFTPLLFIGHQPLSYYISLFCDACVPIFAFVSGYGLYFKYRQNAKNYQQGNWMRLKKLYINYWIIILLFPVILGLLLHHAGFPGTWWVIFQNITAVNPTYSGAWGFFTIYVMFVITSSFWFTLLEKTNAVVFFVLILVLYVIGFYFRIYKTSVFHQPFLAWLHREAALYFCTLFQFMLGAMAFRYQWNRKVAQLYSKLKISPNVLSSFAILAAIVFHAIVPNFIVAPFTGLIFIFAFTQMNLRRWANRLLDALSVHSTNMWLIHMFFYMIFFPAFIYSFRYPVLIFTVLVLCCMGSSWVINRIDHKIQKAVL